MFRMKTSVPILSQALDECTLEKDIAERVKKDFDKKHGPSWHCIVGRNFGSDLISFGKNIQHKLCIVLTADCLATPPPS